MAVELRSLVPATTVEIGAILVAIIVVIGVLYKFMKWFKVLPPTFFSDSKKTFGIGKVASVALSELGERVILQRELIVDSKLRWLAHFCVFWGFVGTAIATTLVYIYKPDGTPRDLMEPAKLFGNGGGILLLIGGTIILGRLLAVREFRNERTFADLSFFVMLYLATITGFTTEMARLNQNQSGAYASYVIHLIAIILLLATAPFTHFFHALLTPVMRFVGRLQQMLMLRGGVNYKHWAMVDQMTEKIAKERKT